METLQTELAVIGGGPGGYTAAFRAADLGKQVVLIEKENRLGGVCLNVGCIPSKTLLHASELIDSAEEAELFGVHFEKPSVELSQLRTYKEQVVSKLTQGLSGLAKARKVTVVTGKAVFKDSSTLEVEAPDGSRLLVVFSDCIIAAGSSSVVLPFFPNQDRRNDGIWTSTEALELREIPEQLAVIGGGIIGLEMAQVYSSLGSKVTIIEMMDQIIPPADADVVRPLVKVLRKRYEAIYTSTKVTGVTESGKGYAIALEGKKAPAEIYADKILVAVGRRPNSGNLGLEHAGVELNAKGFIPVNQQQQTQVPHIYAIGDIVGNPMLAHKASYEAKVAAEVICGRKSAASALTIPSVAYTSPEIAWMGVTEREAQEKGIPYKVGTFPWAASGRALSSNAVNGLSKALFHEETGRLIGAAIVGKHAGELLAESVLALEMGADAEDISKVIHAHPTLSETFALAAEIVDGSITDILQVKKR